MEGGVRQSRASSRYASNPSPGAFNGPVRRWKKQWVATPSPIHNNGSNNRNIAAAPSLLLCRWTPIPAAAAADQTPTRRFRYAPVVPIVKGNRKAPEKVSITSTRNQTSNINGAHITDGSGGMLEKTSSGYMIPGEDEADEKPSEVSNKNDGRAYTSEKRRKTSPTVDSKMLV